MPPRASSKQGSPFGHLVHTVLIDVIDTVLNNSLLMGLFSLLPARCFKTPNFKPAFIMDGNRRFAKQMGLGDSKKPGFNKFLKMVSHCYSLGIREASFFVLSKQNLQRPQREIDELKRLLNIDFREIKRRDVRINVVGDTGLLGREIEDKVNRMVEDTRDKSGIVVNLFIAYSPECDFDGSVDVVIRTGKTRRLSGFLLKQVSQGAHLTFLDCFWPAITHYHVILVYWKFLLEKRLLKLGRGGHSQ